MVEQNEALKLKGTFYISKITDGKIVDTRVVDNLIMDTGRAEVAGLITNPVSATKFQYVAIGTDATPASVLQTALLGEIVSGGGMRMSATGTRVTTTVTNDTGQFSALFTFSTSFALVEAGVFNATDTGVMLCRQTFAAVNVASTDSILITYKIKVS